MPYLWAMQLTHAESRVLFADEILSGTVVCTYGICLPLQPVLEEADLVQLGRILSALKWAPGTWQTFYADPTEGVLPAIPQETVQVLCFGFRNPAAESVKAEPEAEKILYLPSVSEIRLDATRKQEAFRILKPYLNS